MTDKNFYIHAAITAVLLIITVVVGSSTPKVNFNFNKDKPLLGQIATDELNKIIVKSGNDQVDITANDGVFVVSTKSHYPAKISALKKLRNDVLNITRDSLVTENKDNHVSLGVDEKNAHVIVRFVKHDDSVLNSVIVGKEIQNGKGRYVRLGNSDKVYASSSYLDFSTIAMDYINTQLTEIHKSDIDTVSVNNPNGNYIIKQNKEGSFELKTLPEKKYPIQSEIDIVVDSLSSLSFEDFIPSSVKMGLVLNHTYSVKLKTGLVYEMSIATQDDKYYLKAQAVMSKSQRELENELSNKNQNDAEMKKNSEIYDDVKKAEQFSNAHKEWIYEISKSDAEKMMTSHSKLLSDTPEKISASHILISYEDADISPDTQTKLKGVTKEQAKAKAEKILKEALADPNGFAALASKYSDGPTKDKGGDLGSFDKKTMAPAFTEASFKLNVGEITTKLVETKFGFHIIKRTK